MLLYSILPLLLVLIFVNRKKLKSNKFYRFNVFSLNGFFFFFYYPFLLYSVNVVGLDNRIGVVAAVVVIVIIVGACWSPLLATKSYRLSVFFGALFGVGCFVYLVFNVFVQNYLAGALGYYADKLPSKVEFSNPDEIIAFDVNSGLHSISVPKSWDERTLSGYYTYFVKNNDSKDTVEVRVSCHDPKAISIPSAFESAVQYLAFDGGSISLKQCYRGQEFIQCIAKAHFPLSNGSIQARWSMSKYINHQVGITLDVIFYDVNEINKQEVQSIFDSAMQVNKAVGQYYCGTPSAWL